jgi:hypothetical protein
MKKKKVRGKEALQLRNKRKKSTKMMTTIKEEDFLNQLYKTGRNGLLAEDLSPRFYLFDTSLQQDTLKSN